MLRIMGRVHFIVGILFIVLFLMVGVYMKKNFPHLYAGHEGIRMMYRSTHIYLLMAALINLLSASRYPELIGWGSRFFQVVASTLIILAPLLFLAGFMNEPGDYDIGRTYSFWGVLSLLLGVIVMVVVSLERAKPRR